MGFFVVLSIVFYYLYIVNKKNNVYKIKLKGNILIFRICVLLLLNERKMVVK